MREGQKLERKRESERELQKVALTQSSLTQNLISYHFHTYLKIIFYFNFVIIKQFLYLCDYVSVCV